MLPSLKFFICGVLFCVLLFILAGAGVVTPDSRTHIGEMPEVGRPMMQRSMAEMPAQTQVYMMAAARRSDEMEQPRVVPTFVESEGAARRIDELEQPREVAPADAAPGDAAPASQPEPGTASRDASGLSSEVMADATPAGEMTPPTADGSPGVDGAPAAQVHTGPPTEFPSDDRTDDAGSSPQVAVLAPLAAEDVSVVHSAANVPLPLPRPSALNGLRRHARVLHRRHRPVQPYDTGSAGVAAGQAVPSGPGAPGYTAPEAASR